LVIAVFGLSLLLPLLISLAIGDDAQLAFDKVVLLTIGCGLALWLVGRLHGRDLKARDGFLLVVTIWALLPVCAAQPLLFDMPQLSFTDAYSEAMSGLDNLPPSINLWPTQMHFIGGMGVIVLVVAVLPMLGVGGRQMFKAEAPTPMTDTKLIPRMTETAKGLRSAYIILAMSHLSLSPYRYDAGIRRFLAVALLSCLGLAFFLGAQNIYLDFPSALRYATINNMGPGPGQVGPASTYAVLTDFQTWCAYSPCRSAAWNCSRHWWC